MGGNRGYVKRSIHFSAAREAEHLYEFSEKVYLHRYDFSSIFPFRKAGRAMNSKWKVRYLTVSGKYMTLHEIGGREIKKGAKPKIQVSVLTLSEYEDASNLVLPRKWTKP